VTPTRPPSPTATQNAAPTPTPAEIPTAVATLAPSPTPIPIKFSQVQMPALSPPYSGTVGVNPQTIVSTDPSAFESLVSKSAALRLMFDRRSGWVFLNAHIFEATYSDGLTIEVQVNPEFSDPAEAQALAEKYSMVVGQLPKFLRSDVATMWIHKGNEGFGGGNNNLLIHTERALQYEQSGDLEEVFLHEASHTSLDPYHLKSPDWVVAQEMDGQHISEYARDALTGEDLAESFPLYFALRHHPSRISEELKELIRSTIPNRILYFDYYLPVEYVE
jgi:hypothetical protein